MIAGQAECGERVCGLAGIEGERVSRFNGQGFHSQIRQVISMWKPLKVDNIEYVIKTVTVDAHHKVLLSNFVSIWGEEITSASLCRRCKVNFTGHCRVTKYSVT
jgi:hypothetical protein